MLLLVILQLGPVAALPWFPPIRLRRTAPGSRMLEVEATRAAAERLSRYPCRGSTQHGSTLPSGWAVCRSETVVGRGRAAYQRASDALQRLEFFELPWLTCCPLGESITICSRQLGGVWLANTNRVLCRTSTPSRSSVTWGTTTRHILAGEETVAVSWDQGTGEVLFSIVSFSRPRHMLSLLSYPYVRAQQRRFARDAALAMERFASE